MVWERTFSSPAQKFKCPSTTSRSPSLRSILLPLSWPRFPPAGQSNSKRAFSALLSARIFSLLRAANKADASGCSTRRDEVGGGWESLSLRYASLDDAFYGASDSAK